MNARAGVGFAVSFDSASSWFFCRSIGESKVSEVRGRGLPLSLGSANSLTFAEPNEQLGINASVFPSTERVLTRIQCTGTWAISYSLTPPETRCPKRTDLLFQALLLGLLVRIYLTLQCFDFARPFRKPSIWFGYLIGPHARRRRFHGGNWLRRIALHLE